MPDKNKAQEKNKDLIDDIFDAPPGRNNNSHGHSSVLVSGLVVAVVAGLLAGVIGVAVVLSGSLSALPLVNSFSLESVLPDQQIVIKRQQAVTVTLEEQISSLAAQAGPAIVGFAARKKTPEGEESVYINDDLMGTGIILTGDGWLAANSEVFRGYEADEVVALYGNDKVIAISEIIEDEITGVTYAKAEAENLLVSRTAEDWEPVTGKRLVALTNSYPSTQLRINEVFVVGYNEQELVLDSDTAARVVLFSSSLDLPYQPVFNLAGEAVGLSGSEQGEPYIILAANFMPVFKSILQTGIPSHPRLGLEWINLHGNPGLSSAIRQGRNRGAYVSRLLSDSPAAEVGIKAGDIITMVNDQELNGRQNLGDLIQRYSPGDIIYLSVIRDNETLELAVELDSLTN